MQMARMEKLAHKVYKDYQDLQGQWVTKAQLENLEGMVNLEHKAMLDLEEILEQMVHQGNLGLQVQLDLLEKEVHLDQLELEVSKVCLEHLESLEMQEKMEQLAYLVNLE